MTTNLESAGREGSAEHDFPRVLADIHEDADTDDRVAEAADIHVAFPVHLSEREKGNVETAAVVEVELIGLVDHRVVVLSRAGIGPHQRRAPNEALLIRQHDLVKEAFFRRDRRHARRNASAEIANGTWGDLHGGPARDDLSLREGQPPHPLKRDTKLARVARVVVAPVRLPLAFIDDHIVDENPWDLDATLRQGPALCQSLDLKDDSSAEPSPSLRRG